MSDLQTVEESGSHLSDEVDFYVISQDILKFRFLN